jgi:electron transport complex protein RnfG
MKKVIYSTLFIVIIAVASAFTLTMVNNVTSPKIRENSESRLVAIINTTFPEFSRIESTDNTHLIYSGEVLLGYGVESSSMGYSGMIDVFVLFDRDKTIKEVVITKMSETPDIGSRVEEEEFRKHFRGKTVKDLNSKELGVDAITGATISSAAVIEAVIEAGETYDEK